MRFTCATEIDLPVAKVIEMFDNTDNLKNWQNGLVSYEHVSGSPGAVGSKSRINIKTGKHAIELSETILVKNLPHESRFCVSTNI